MLMLKLEKLGLNVHTVMGSLYLCLHGSAELVLN